MPVIPSDIIMGKSIQMKGNETSSKIEIKEEKLECRECTVRCRSWGICVPKL
jgi:hypothetical protein